MEKLNEQVRRQLEQCLESADYADRFQGLLDEALGIAPPKRSDWEGLLRLMKEMATELPVGDAVLLAFDLGRVYERREGEHEEDS